MKRTAILRWSLLASLGLLPLACGGDDDDDDTGDTAGSAGKGGSAGSGGSVAGGSGGAVTFGGAGAGGDAPSRLPTCTNPTEDAAGLTRCDEGYRYRAEAQTCAFRANEPGGGGAGGGAGGESPAQEPRCAECNGERDVCYQSAALPVTYTCTQGCLTDDECADGAFCLCDGTRGGLCVPSSCREDADCGDGFHCAETGSPCATSLANFFACQTPEDECLGDAECSSGHCMLRSFTSGERVCNPAVCGRPFLVESAMRQPGVVLRKDWAEPQLMPRVDELSSSEREAQAAHWSKLGQMEHASIAAFARFQLQLLALGAPPELVQACNQALVDETAHTRLCFALASAYAGKSIGPGPLNVEHSLDVTSVADIVDLVIAEGCFGETSAALEALESADAASDPVIREAYARIAADEQQHAALAFQFVRWALESGSEEVRARVTSVVQAPPSLSGSVRAVALPCLRALLGAGRLAIPEPALSANCAIS